jgi:glycosyltransferase involved in cell wall biosynthesis
MIKELGRKTAGALDAADAARDAGDWSEAARRYRVVLNADPALAHIWVQYGHALKESGALAEAETAYRRAISIDPQVSDFHLQLGHALKLRGDRDAAEAAYVRAYALDRRSKAAMQELIGMGADLADIFEDDAGSSRRAECVAIDLSDLFFYLRHHHTVSGIQRVQLGIADGLLGIKLQSDRDFRFVIDAGPSGGYLELRASALVRLKRELAREEVNHERLIEIMAEAQKEATLFIPETGDVLVVMGAFWVIENAVERFVGLKRLGVRLVILIHDIIPITHPEYCEASLTDTFNSFCLHVLQIADLVLTVSDHTGAEVKRYLAGRDVRAPLIKTLRSAHQSWRSGNATPPPRRVETLAPRSFVLFVSTIEIRKNHLLLFRVWKQLTAKHGASAMPKLVFVGRQGWRVRDLMDQLESTRRLDGAVVILNGMSDAELSRLYRDCLFSAFPSFEEGWGLPVGEGLIHGRPCIASGTSSIPEVGGDYAVYADPDDLKESMSLYERMIFDAPYREGLAERIRSSFTPRTWDDVTADLVALLAAHAPLGGEASSMPAPPALPAGRFLEAGHRGDVGRFLSEGIGEVVHFIFDEAWGPVEEFGRWMSRRNGSIELGVERPCDGEVMLILCIDSPPWTHSDLRLRLTVNGQSFAPIKPQPGSTARVVLDAESRCGKLLIEFAVEGPIAMGPDPRPLTIGVRAFGYCGKN